VQTVLKQFQTDSCSLGHGTKLAAYTQAVNYRTQFTLAMRAQGAHAGVNTPLIL